MLGLSPTFDALDCLNLDRRRDRWDRLQAQIPEDWPFRRVEQVSAVDGKLAPPPDWWTQGRGAWGCYRSHLRCIEHALNAGMESVLLLENDAKFCDGFTAKIPGIL